MIAPVVLMADAAAYVMPLGSTPRLPSSVAAVPEASQRTARVPLGTPDPSYFWAYPTIAPAALMANASACELPLGSVPKVPSSVAAVPDASQRTARDPLSTKPSYLAATPTVVPAVFRPHGRVPVRPLKSVPRLPSSVMVPEVSHRTARTPRFRKALPTAVP